MTPLQILKMELSPETLDLLIKLGGFVITLFAIYKILVKYGKAIVRFFGRNAARIKALTIKNQELENKLKNQQSETEEMYEHFGEKLLEMENKVKITQEDIRGLEQDYKTIFIALLNRK